MSNFDSCHFEFHLEFDLKFDIKFNLELVLKIELILRYTTVFLATKMGGKRYTELGIDTLITH